MCKEHDIPQALKNENMSLKEYNTQINPHTLSLQTSTNEIGSKILAIGQKVPSKNMSFYRLKQDKNGITHSIQALQTFPFLQNQSSF